LNSHRRLEEPRILAMFRRKLESDGQAGVPNAVHGAFIRASPVVARPRGAGPVAAGTRITGVVL
jgi:hypothetical protein